MKRNIYMLAMVLALSTALAVAQAPPTDPYGTNPQTTPPSGQPDASQPSPQPGEQQPGQQQDDPFGQEQQQQDRDRQEARVDDSQLEQQVRDRLQQDPALHNVRVSVDDGTVNLEGTVASKDEKKRAKKMAKEVAGVRRVRDRELRVDENAAAAGQAAPGTQQEMGQQTATGETQTGQEQQQAGIAAPGQPAGQTTMGTETGAQTGAQAGQTGQFGTQAGQDNDRQVRQRVRMQFRDPVFEDVCISVDRGVVRLVGTVQSEQDRQRARQMVQGVQGVTQVDDQHLRVVVVDTTGMGQTPDTGQETGTGTGIATPDQSTGTTQPDAMGTTQPDATGTQQGVTQPDTQTTPDSPGAQQSGQMGAAGDTEQLHSQIHSALRNEPTLSGANLSVHVTDNTIELSGTVRTGQERQTARRIAESYAGNRRVEDRLTVTGMGVGPDQQQPEQQQPEQQQPEQQQPEEQQPEQQTRPEGAPPE